MKKKYLIIIFILFYGQTLSASSPYQINSQQDYPIIVTAFTIGVLPQIFGKELSTQTNKTNYNKKDINSFDRSLMGGHCTECGTISNILVVSVPLGSLALLQNKSTYNIDTLWEDAILYAEGLSITGALGQVVRRGIKRPRPYVYDNNLNDNKHNKEDRLSFYSGHTASVFTAAALFDHIADKRFPNENLFLWRTIFYSSASLVGATRIASGDHFATDVLAGAALGYAVGSLVPYFHLKKDQSASCSIYPTIQSNLLAFKLQINF